MSLTKKLLCTGLTTAGLLATVMASGCAVHAGVGYRVYDPYYTDYHVWNDGEVGFYNRWTVETHRDSHRDFRKLNHDDQHEYWKWRHEHH
jgi:hypothetical protein